MKKIIAILSIWVAIARVTFSEITRDRILYNILLAAAFVFGVGYLASRLTYGHPERIILDFGLSAVNVSCTAIAILTGSSMLGREFERRTYFLALSRPISGLQFVIGKFFGLSAVLFVNWLLLSVSYLLILSLVSTGLAEGVRSLGETGFMALFLLFWQSLVVAGLSLALSTFSTTSLAAVMSFGLYLIGNNISELRAFVDKVGTANDLNWLRVAIAVLPNFEYFNIGAKVTYQLPVPADLVASHVLYGSVLVGICLLLSGLLVRLKV